MGTYTISGPINLSARYVGEFVPSDDLVQYFYAIAAYDRAGNVIATNASDPFAYGPEVLDGNHAISVQWQPLIGASSYNVYKRAGSEPDLVDDIFWYATASETGVLDVGYACTTRNSFLNPGLSPLFAAGCCGYSASEATNVPPAGMAPPDDGHEGGGFVRIQNLGQMLFGSRTRPAGRPGDVQFNKDGQSFGADLEFYWDEENKRLGIHTRTPKYPLDVDGE